MNENDLENLNFLLSTSAEGLQEWFKVADADDLLYAEELLQQYVLANLDYLVDKSDLSEAKNYLKKFTTGV